MLDFVLDAILAAIIPTTKLGWALWGVVLFVLLLVAAAIFQWWLILT